VNARFEFFQRRLHLLTTLAVTCDILFRRDYGVMSWSTWSFIYPIRVIRMEKIGGSRGPRNWWRSSCPSLRHFRRYYPFSVIRAPRANRMSNQCWLTMKASRISFLFPSCFIFVSAAVSKRNTHSSPTNNL
jgi:hypothetical protein